MISEVGFQVKLSCDFSESWERLQTSMSAMAPRTSFYSRSARLIKAIAS
jgi:hypothetical protein